MSELKSLCESLDNIKNANELTFSFSDRVETMECFRTKSETFIACRDVAIRVAENRIERLEKEFNEL